MSLNLNVAKFGGTSVADFDAMNRSADVVLQDSNTRLVVLSASAGITNLLVSLAEGQETSQRAAQLDDIRRIQYAIIDRLNNPDVIRDEIDRIIDNIGMLSDAAARHLQRLNRRTGQPRRTHVDSAVCRDPA